MRISVSAAALLCCGLSTAALAKSPAKNYDQAHIPGQAIVAFDRGVSLEAKEAVIAGNGAKVLHVFKSGAMLVEFRGKINPTLESMLVNTLAQEKNVKYVEANTLLYADAVVPNDPRFGELYGLHNDGVAGGTADADIDAPEAWTMTTGSRDVVVAVIDTGVDYTHPDIAPNYWQNPGETGMDADGNDKSTNGIDDDGNGYIDDFRGWDFVNNDNDPMDDHNHGTHCAGTIGAKGNDGTGVAGVAWDVSIVGVKFLSATGSGSLADAVKAIEYTTSLGVTLTSNSWGGGGFSDTMYAAISGAQEAGVLFVAAAGNSAANNDANPHYPSSYDHDIVVAVAATDNTDGVASFSCYGLTSVDLGAPGKDILSTTKANTYAVYSGTSMATPHVSGVAALIKAAYPDATAAQIKARLMNTADPVASLAGKSVTGGRLNAYNALENDSIAPGVVEGIVLTGAGTTSLQLTWQAAGDDGDIGTARRYEVRYATTPITDEAAWNAASKANVDVSTAANTNDVSAVVNGLSFNTNGFLAVKAVDNVGNVGPLSDSLPFAVRQVTKIAENRAETMDDVTADAPWGVQAEAARQGNVFSDSPEGQYANDLDVSLVLAPIDIDSPDVTLAFSTAYDLEASYDFGHVEISTDGGTSWQPIDTLTGSSSWRNVSYNLNSYLAGVSSFQIRFRMTTDYSLAKDGWKIDDISVFAPL